MALSGSFEVKLNDGIKTTSVTLNKPNKGLLIPTGIWRELENFSSGAVCLVLSSGEFDESDYIRDFKKFKLYYSKITTTEVKLLHLKISFILLL